mmetsp:Transcript_30664/g.49212  ORF Transcript_30664/g.49212 Transcript_30664/m.49212 type:complete len:500 (-) Transcript_30664:148-1647(-)|eukprot:CAMPEP_0203749330 /NCGR_PEP_ID=MMETSP0098-20131031/3937_1 /ASSEMBLY_ACC=CAM_ASM_000208 /TAXON_ID=96639 /ORGANISM=" , Strain NY0313808BC1" /LENGTH=499 /DNA_ID=CAMNT_0050638367 /DNA_START=20 /DNA_END=1519 /DNA_ORIENTATION=+
MLLPISKLGVSALVCLGGMGANGIDLPKMFGSRMVLQQGEGTRIWGKSKCPSVSMEHQNGNEKMSYSAKVAADTTWEIELHPQKVSTNNKLVFTDCHGSVELDDVLFGELFFCSGQSNMEFSVNQELDHDKVIQEAHKFKNLRWMTGDRVEAKTPIWDVKPKTNQSWWAGSVEAFGKDDFSEPSAVCYMTCLNLYKHMGEKVPIGFVGSYWGGQPVEKFSSADAMNDPTCGGTVENPVVSNPQWQHVNGVLYNSLVYPYLRMNFKSLMWYQGEANANDAVHYKCRFPSMISDWRKKMNKPRLPFYFVQLADFQSNDFIALREAQMEALKLPKVGYALAIDTGNKKDIHPKDKKTVGKRLFLSILKHTYNCPKVESDIGPSLHHIEIKGNVATIVYNENTAKNMFQNGTQDCGVCCKESPFQVKYEGNSTWVRIPPNVSNNIVTLQLTGKVSEIQYAYEKFVECSLYSRFGGLSGDLPARPFHAKTSGKTNQADPLSSLA